MTLVADVMSGARHASDLWQGPLVGAAYSLQPLAPPYQEMERDVRALLGEIDGSWLDIGCGSGRTTQVLLEQGADKVVAGDISDSAMAFARGRLRIAGLSDRISMQTINVCKPLEFADGSFDGAFAGLVMQYAESKDEQGRYSLDGYLRALTEVKRVLRPRAPFVWTVNVPDPDFSLIVRRSWRQIFWTPYFVKRLPAAMFLRWQSDSLKREAAKGRFHYLPISQVEELAHAAGFAEFRSVLTYSGQAWAILCR